MTELHTYITADVASPSETVKDPRVAGYGQRKILRKGDYYNLAQLAGKTHLEYVTPLNATVLRSANWALVDWNHVNFVGEVAVSVQVRTSMQRWVIIRSPCAGSS